MITPVGTSQASKALCFVAALVAAMNAQTDDGQRMRPADLASINSACEILTPTAVAHPDDLRFLEDRLAAMTARVGYRVLQACAEADATVEAGVQLETRKDYSNPLKGTLNTRVDYVVLRLTVMGHSGGAIWTDQFDELYRPGKVQKILESLLERAERRLQKDRSR